MIQSGKQEQACLLTRAIETTRPSFENRAQAMLMPYPLAHVEEWRDSTTSADLILYLHVFAVIN